MVTLQNDALKAVFDARGALVHLENLLNGRGNIISRPEAIYGAVFSLDGNWEQVAFAEEQDARVSAKGNAVEIFVRGLRSKDAEADVDLRMTIRLEADRLVFTADVENRSGALITDFYYPRLGALKTLGCGKPDLIWPCQAGMRQTNIAEHLDSLGDRYDGRYTLSMSYPGLASMCWMGLEDGDQALYLGSHDEKLHATILRAKGSDDHDILLEMDKLAFVKPGETWACPPAVLMLYAGDWKRGADAYSAWARTWRTPPTPPDWVQDMAGYFLVINKQQYGDNLWPYDTLPELYELAQAHGCDTLGLFGWYETGHDNGYPDLAPSETLGGADALRAQIAAVRARGGHVTLYYQGHLMDTDSAFYREKGDRLEAKSRWNAPYLEEYSKYHHSGYLQHFSKKLFSTVCPSCPEWHDLMAGRMDWIASLGSDGALYDQIGGMPAYPCFDERHPHMEGRPSLAYTQGRRSLLARIRAQAKANGSEFAFFSEHITDAYSQYLDALHGMETTPSQDAPGARAALAVADGLPSTRVHYPELFRYCFPETIITVRNPRPYLSPRMVNYAFFYGLRFEMELRYLNDQTDIRAGKHEDWRAYAARVTALRRAYGDILLRGRFRGDTGFTNENPKLTAARYEGEARSAIALWNDTEEAQPVRIGGVTIRGWVSPEGEGEGCPAPVESGGILLLLT